MLRVINIHSLFWKIFFAFWLALLLIVLITAFLTNYLINFEERRPLGSITLEKHASKAVKIFENEGKAELIKYFNEVQNSHGVNEYLFDNTNTELAGKTYSHSVERAINMFENIEDNHVFIRGPVRTGAIKYETKAGDQYIFVSQIAGRGPHFREKGLEPGRFGKRGPPGPPLEMYILLITVSLFVTGLISYLLSSYLVTPIQRVRSATKKLSAGDLSVRVSSTVSTRKDELGGLGKDFDQMAERLESLMSSQQRMLRDVSHELRTPLARLQVALELARTKSKNTSKDEHDRIEYEAQRLNHLIGQILELVRMEQRETTVALTTENVAEIVRHVVKDANFEAAKQKKGVQLTTVEDCNLDINDELLSSAIENIVRNAVTYSPENSNVEISVEKHTEEKEYLRITVLDFGPGVPKESLEHLFEPFYKIRSRDNVDSSGYGIGLAIAERAVRLHNGKISAQNGKERGLVITIELPID